MTQTLEEKAKELWELWSEQGEPPGVFQIIGALRDVEQQALDMAAKEVPANWCDPLLSGPGNKLGAMPWGCPNVESLLSAIKANIRALQGRK